MTHRTAAAEPFEIHVAQRELDDLQRRLDSTRFTSVPQDSGWKPGTEREYLREVTGYWSSHYDWRAREAELNLLPQFEAEVDGAYLHFVHVRGSVSGSSAKPLPLLLLHGWPDSFFRFHKVIPLLAVGFGGREACTAFDLVVPTLPGFAFTGPVQVPANGQPLRHSAQLLWRLMSEVLGYDRFAIAGGDGGSAIAQLMALEHPEAVIAIHLTDLGWHALNVDRNLLSKSERKYVDTNQKRFMTDGAYLAVQSTRPRSLAGLNDSPVGLASWILDRFHAWCDFDHDLEEAVSRDDLLTNIMLYWVTQTIGSSMFDYYTETRSPSLTPSDRVRVPVALALFPKDIGGIPPRSLAERTLNVQRWTELPCGGHFAPLEQPEVYARDLIDFACTLQTDGAQYEQEAHHVARTL